MCEWVCLWVHVYIYVALQAYLSLNLYIGFSVYLSHFYNLSFPQNQSAIEWAQGMICQNSSEMERTRCPLTILCCDMLEFLLYVIQDYWRRLSQGVFCVMPPFGLYSVRHITNDPCTSHPKKETDWSMSMWNPTQTQRWTYMNILVLLSLWGCSADYIYYIYSYVFPCFSLFKSVADLDVVAFLTPMAATVFIPKQHENQFANFTLSNLQNITHTTWIHCFNV